MTEAETLLNIEDLVVRYGEIVALRGVDLTVRRGEIVAIVGPNGAGKTSLLSTIAGVVRPAEGTIRWLGTNLAELGIEGTVRGGVALVPEGRHVFARLTVTENLQIGATIRKGDASVQQEISRYFEVFPILGERRNQQAGLLSGGEQQQLVIARALMSKPQLLLLDEPSLGLAPRVIDDVYSLIGRVRDDGVTILLVEQNAPRALKAADRTFVLNGGSFRLGGNSKDMSGHKDFEAAYFGVTQPTGATTL